MVTPLIVLNCGRRKTTVAEMWHNQSSYMSVIYTVCMLLGSNQERDFQ